VSSIKDEYIDPPKINLGFFGFAWIDQAPHKYPCYPIRFY